MRNSLEQEKKSDTLDTVDLSKLSEGEIQTFWYQGNQFEVSCNTEVSKKEKTWKFFVEDSNSELVLTGIIWFRNKPPYFRITIGQENVVEMPSITTHVKKVQDQKNSPAKLGGAFYEKMLDYISVLESEESYVHRIAPMPSDGLYWEKWKKIFVPILEKRGYICFEDNWHKVFER